MATFRCSPQSSCQLGDGFSRIDGVGVQHVGLIPRRSARGVLFLGDESALGAELPQSGDGQFDLSDGSLLAFRGVAADPVLVVRWKQEVL